MAKTRIAPFAAIPHEVIDSPAYADISHSAARLLLLITRQSTGKNNGQLQASYSYCEPRGIGGKHTLAAAIKDLLSHGFIFRTRGHGFQSGRNIPARYAVTYFPLGDREHLKGLFLDGFKPNAWKEWKQ